MTDAGRHGLGHSYQLTFDNTTFTSHRRNHGLGYVTTADRTCTTFDASAWAVANAVQFAGIALLDLPHTYITDALSGPWESERYTPSYDAQPAAHRWEMTVLHRCRTDAIAAEDITAGDLIMMTDEGDGTTYTHDGMFSPAVTTQANEMYSAIGIAETAADVAASHDTHDDTWNQNTGEYTAEHPLFWINLWK